MAIKPTPTAEKCSIGCAVCEVVHIKSTGEEISHSQRPDALKSFRPNFKPKAATTRVAEQYLSFNKNMIIDETDNDDDTMKAEQHPIVD